MRIFLLAIIIIVIATIVIANIMIAIVTNIFVSILMVFDSDHEYDYDDEYDYADSYSDLLILNAMLVVILRFIIQNRTQDHCHQRIHVSPDYDYTYEYDDHYPCGYL